MPESALIHGLLLGAAAAGTIGPVNIEIARRTLRIGWSAGFLLGCGAVTVDFVYAILSSLGMAPLLTHPTIAVILGIAGGLLLIALGFLSAMAAFQPLDLSTSITQRPSPPVSYATGLAMTSINPITVAFWFISVPGSLPTRGGQTFEVALGVFLAAFAWIWFFPATIHFAGQRLRGRVLTITDLLGSAALLTFGGISIWRVIG
ncbi:MAG TPA: LysE family transporter [Tepidisphaeraceae bacterium]|nr:LysE family transporter [Tepidisphaeraceae bacterium]